MDLNFNIKGLDNVIQNMTDLPLKLQRSGARKAVRRGMNVVRDAARASAAKFDDPKTSESIAKNIVTQSMSRRYLLKLGAQRGDIGMRVGVLGGARQYADSAENRRKRRAGATYDPGGSKGNPGGDTWYWRFIEFGRGPVKLKSLKRGDSRKSLVNAQTGQFFGKEAAAAKAQPFMRPALSQNVGLVTDKVVSELIIEIDKAIQK